MFTMKIAMNPHWKQLARIATFFCLCLCLGVVPPAAAQFSDNVDETDAGRRAVAAMLEGGTVFILAENFGELGIGSGFVVQDGFIMTNAHVIERAKKILVMNDLLPPTEAKVVARDHKGNNGENDFALLRVKMPRGVSLPVLTFNIRVDRMDRVSAWGFPAMVSRFDANFQAILAGRIKNAPPVVFTEGVVSAIIRKRTKAIIHTAAIASGNSGGPLVNRKGEVVGINTWGYAESSEGAFVNAALTSEDILKFLLKQNIRPRMANRSPRLESAPGPRPSREPLPEAQAESRRTEGSGAPSFADNRLETLAARAAKGDPEAQMTYGYMLYMGEGVHSDAEKAVYWLKRSAAQGNDAARGVLGVIYFLEPDFFNPREGLALLRAAASAPNPDPEVQAFLATLYYQGTAKGVSRDAAESYKWASKAADKGSADGMAQLGFLYYYGEGTRGDMGKALTLAKAAVAKNSALGKALLAWMHYDGAVVEENFSRALDLAMDAAEEDVPPAQGLLAYMYANGAGVPRDAKTAEAWARRAADQGNEFGQCILGEMYLDGSVVKRDNAMAWALLDMAASANFKEAGELRDKAAARMSEADLRRAGEIQKQWRAEWGVFK